MEKGKITSVEGFPQNRLGEGMITDMGRVQV